MGATLPIKAYEILEAKLGKEDARELVSALEEIAKALAKESKLELKDDLKNELVTRGELDLLRKEFHAELKALRAEFRMYFIILVCLIIILNPKAIDLLAKLLGVIK